MLKQGPRITANSRVVGDQHHPAIAALATNNLAVLWTDEAAGARIVGQIFSSDGQRLGGEFVVAAGEGAGGAARVADAADLAAGPGGGFAASYETAPATGNGETRLHLQLLTASGAIVQPPGVYDRAPSPGSASFTGEVELATLLASGRQVAVYGAYDGSRQEVRIRIFDSGGHVAASAVIEGGDPEFPGPHAPAVAALSTGGFVVSWQAFTVRGLTPQGIIIGDIDVMARRFDMSGTPVGGAVVAGSAAGDQLQSDVTALDGGGFAVAWSDPASSSIRVQIYSASNVRIGDEVAIASAAPVSHPRLVSLTSGTFVVAWRRVEANGTMILAQEISATGEKIGDELSLDNAAAGSAPRIDLAALGEGLFAAVWDDEADPDGGSASMQVVASSRATPRFTGLADVVDFNDVANSEPGGLTFALRDSNYRALGGDDVVVLPRNAAEARQAGYDPTHVFFGDDGNDVIVAGAGGDAIDGGAGVDVASYANAPAGVTANLQLGAGAGGEAQGDAYNGIENLIGSSFNDVLVGRAGIANTLNGGSGNDTFYGEGLDTFVGGAGLDTLFGSLGTALNVNLGTAQIETAWGGFLSDTLNGATAAFNLTLVGQGPTADRLTGGSGNDFVYFRNGDIIAGGAGADWAVATLSGTGVNLNLATTGFENSWGSTSADTLTAAGASSTVVLVGDAGADTLTGGAAGDFIYGGAGDDMLNGGSGNDNLIGDGGVDTFRFGAGWGVDIVWGWANGAEKFNLAGAGATGFAQLTVNQNFNGSGNALISFGANRILVVGAANQIDAGDFLFA